MDAPIRQTLADAVAFLGERGISYALIGGLAASLQGQPRFTADVDLVIKADVDDGLRLVEALDGSKFAPLFVGVKDVVERAFLLPVRHRLTGIKVDLALGLSGFERQAIDRAKLMSLGGGDEVVVASAEDLLIMKLLAGRPQDEQDVSGLVTARGESLDWNYCEQTAVDLGQAIDQDLVVRVRELRSRC